MYSKSALYIAIILSIIINTACSNNSMVAPNIVDSTYMSKTVIEQDELDSESIIEYEEKRIILNSVDYNLCLNFTNEQLMDLSNDELSILRNAIYAKYGYSFSNQKYVDFFSNYAWYSEIDKDVESKLNDTDHENVKLILEYEALAKRVFKSSVENNYTFENKEIEIIVDEIETSESSNFPKRVTLKNANIEIVFESYWNDGIRVEWTDFDVSDEYKDVYITELGTDISFDTYIYRYNSEELFEYAKFNHFNQEFIFDESGSIYFALDPENGADINSLFNYKTKEIGEIEKRLKYRLNSIE